MEQGGSAASDSPLLRSYKDGHNLGNLLVPVLTNHLDKDLVTDETQVVDQPLLNPRCEVVRMPDPRTPRGTKSKVGVIAFFHQDKDAPCDTLCNASFLGNCFDLGHGGLQLEVPHLRSWLCCANTRRSGFRTAEAAFQALKFWSHAKEFQLLSGTEANQLRKQLTGSEDWTYSGLGDNWNAMMWVLRAKFRHPVLADGLLSTKDAFILHHNSVVGQDDVWSDNGDGAGMNWLGLQLMILREELQDKLGSSTKGSNWTPFLGRLLDLSNGDPVSLPAQSTWHNLVRGAAEALNSELQRSETWSIFNKMRSHPCKPARFD